MGVGLLPGVGVGVDGGVGSAVVSTQVIGVGKAGVGCGPPQRTVRRQRLNLEWPRRDLVAPIALVLETAVPPALHTRPRLVAISAAGTGSVSGKSSSSSSRMAMPWSPVSGISGLSNLRACVTASGHRRTRRKPRRW